MTVKGKWCRSILAILCATASGVATAGQNTTPASAGKELSRTWVSDQGDGTYRNPVLYADYSDPDAIRVGGDYYLVASSFDQVPGLPILHSYDLVNWTLLSYALPQQPPAEEFSQTQHGNGVWAPSIRYHDGQFWIFYPDPDRGIYMMKATRPEGPWSKPLLMKAAKGWIDPCPLWDDDGNAYLVSGMAGSRSGIKSVLIVSRMSKDGTQLLDDGAIVFDGHAKHPTVEGPKFYKRDGYYYIFAPAGGVPTGWQLILRSRNIYGPYEEKIVLAQGKASTNGPHQGAWVDTETGEDWFLHFQDAGPYGRILHLEPMKWVDGWPRMGTAVDSPSVAVGEPVLRYRKPKVHGGPWPKATPAESDEFNGAALGLQWQWQANPQPNWYFPAPSLGVLRLFNVGSGPGFSNPAGTVPANLWNVPNLLTQKFPAPVFTATAKVHFRPLREGERTGLVVLGQDYATLQLRQLNGKQFVEQVVCKDAAGKGAEQISASAQISGDVYLRAAVSAGARVRFSYSTDGKHFQTFGTEFQAKEGVWIGAKIGLFAVGNGEPYESGFADYDWFHME